MNFYTPKIVPIKNGQTLTIRSATAEDARLLLDYMDALLTDAPYILTSKKDFKMTLEQERIFLENVTNSKTAIMLLALDDGKIVGNADIRAGRFERTIHRAEFGMSVLPAYRGLGVGKVLLQEIISISKQNSIIKKLELGVIESNLPAIQLYESFGFQEEGRSVKGFRSDDGKYLDEIRMGLFIESLS